MKIILLFVFGLAIAGGHLITSGLEPLDPSELLASITLSAEKTALLQPENVTETNFKLRLLVQRLTTLDDLCDGTAKPILCRRTLKWPMRNLQQTYAQLANWHETVKENGSLNNKMMLSEETVKAKEHLARLENNTVLAVAKSSMHEH